MQFLHATYEIGKSKQTIVAADLGQLGQSLIYRSYFTKNIVMLLPTFIFSENVIFYILL